jgi:hypothetical protein
MRNRMGVASAVILGVAALGAAGSASAGHLTWGPENITSHLRGTLSFVTGAGQPFRCQVEWTVKTGNFTNGAHRQPKVRSAIALGKACSSVTFSGLPWSMEAFSRHIGDLGSLGFTGNRGSCSQVGLIFTSRPNGEWDLPLGNCLVGKLTSDPPIMIITRP